MNLDKLMYKNKLPNGETRLERHQRKTREAYYKKIEAENNEPARARAELKRFTPEERKAFYKWYRQWKKQNTAS